MANKTTKNKKWVPILGLCIAIATIITIIVIIVMSLTKKNDGVIGLNDSYFISDNSKYVIPISGDEIYLEEEMPTPSKYYMVYNYDNDNITGLKSYFVFETEENAKNAYDYLITNEKDYYDSINIDNNYVILSHFPADYDGITASDVKLQIDLIESAE